MSDQDQTGPVIIDHLLKTMEKLGGHILDVKAGVVRVETELKSKANKDDIAELRLSMKGKATKKDVEKAVDRHSKNPAAHGFVAGLTRGQWMKIVMMITAACGLLTTIFGYFFIK